MGYCQPARGCLRCGGVKISLWYDGDPDTLVPLSSRNVDADVRVLLGRSMYPFPGYVTGEVGYRIRDGLFSNETIYALEAGSMVNRFLIKGYFSGIHTFESVTRLERWG